jgi:hypothetical protein
MTEQQSGAAVVVRLENRCWVSGRSVRVPLRALGMHFIVPATTVRSFPNEPYRSA